MKIAVMDIGSNSVRLMLQSDGKTLYKKLNTSRLGEKIAVNGYLLPEAIERTVNAISEFCTLAANEGAEKIYAFATAAVRSASNKKDFTDKVKNECGIDVEVISGDEEACLGLIGAVGDRDGGIIDVGGASSELSIKIGGERVYCKSINIGAGRLFDLCGRNEDKLLEVIDKKIAEYGDITAALNIYAIGGTATSLASIYLGLKEYDPKRVHGTELTLSDMKNICDKLSRMTKEEITESYCLDSKRAEIIFGGALLVYKIMEKIGSHRVIVSESDNLEGYVISRGLQ